MWQTSVPVIVVITKSYSVPERKENIEMVQAVFAGPEGIMELIDATNDLMPEGLQAGTEDIANFKLSRKRYLCQGIIGVATTSGTVVGAVPISIADAVILKPIEITEINAIAKVYGIKNDQQTKKFFNSIIEVGTVSIAAKTAIAALKNIPGINIGASILNAIIAGSIIAAIGEGTTYIFEQIYLEKRSFEDIGWVTKVLQSKLSNEFIDKVKTIISKTGNQTDSKKTANLISAIFNND